MKFTFDFSKETGTIRPMHAVGQPPRRGIEDTYMHYLTDAHIPFSRLHDVGGDYGGNMFVDIPNIFRDFDANEYDPAAYDFGFTDLLLKQLAEAHCAPIFRLGVTIENYQHIRAYRIQPPKDFAKWARICEHIIRHYNEGWADGFHYGIRYWEIWNEPDGHWDDHINEMWHGTAQEYYELYEITAKHLKKRFGNTIKVGGYASCGFYGIYDPADKPNPRNQYFLTFFHGFLDHVRQTGAPLDFFSWHSYDSVENTLKMASYVEQQLALYGFDGVETQCNEWNNASAKEHRGTSYAAAQAAAMMIAMHDTKTDIMCYYDARIGTSCYGGLFHPMTYEPLCTYYAFKAYGELYALGRCAEVRGGSDELRALAASDGNGSKAVLIANTGSPETVETNLPGMKVYLLDQDRFLTETDLDSRSFRLEENQVALLKSAD